jgi:hemoglobin-like flavoprotein
MKLVLAVILSMCVAYSAGAGCDLLQRFKVKHQWSEAFGQGHQRLEFGVKVFNSLFHDHPETRAVFTRVNGANPYSAEFKAHAERVLGGLDMTIGLLDDQAALTAQIAHLKEQHTTRNVKPEYYVWLGEELFDLIPEQLGVKFDFGAWSDCYKVLISGLTS